MSRKHKHEDHLNHEAWAIPYADLMTLLLAFFVVMYAVSSVNEGKYRVLSDSLSEAFGGPPRSMKPMQMGKIAKEGESPTQQSPANIVRFNSPIRPIITPVAPPPHGGDPGSQAKARAQRELAKLGEALVEALGDLIDKDLITVRRGPMWLEVELKTDIYFASGSAVPNAKAVETMQRMAVALLPFPNPIRIEGYTDNVPISTFQFPSNWELSSARAASVVHVFVDHGITPERMAITGFSDQRAKESNDSVEGRAANRRVLLVIMALPADPALDQSRMGSSASNTDSEAGGAGRS